MIDKQGKRETNGQTNRQSKPSNHKHHITNIKLQTSNYKHKITNIISQTSNHKHQITNSNPKHQITNIISQTSNHNHINIQNAARTEEYKNVFNVIQ